MAKLKAADMSSERAQAAIDSALRTLEIMAMMFARWAVVSSLSSRFRN